MAESELKRRGTTIPSEVELSGHAIDRASMMDDNEWQEAGGVHSWLTVISNEASKLVVDDEVVLYKGYRFVFVIGNHYPVLKTIIDKRKKQKTK